MVTPGKKRTKAWREGIIKAGGKNLSVMLDSETAQKWERLQDAYQEGNVNLAARAIQSLYDQTFRTRPRRDRSENQPDLFQSESVTGDKPPTRLIVTRDRTNVTGDTADQLKQIALDLGPTGNLWGNDQTRASKVFSRDRRTLLLPVIQDLAAQGYGPQDIATMLNQAHVPTISGTGLWNRGSTGNALKLWPDQLKKGE